MQTLTLPAPWPQPPEKGLCGQQPNSRPPLTSKRLVWCPPSLMLSGLQAQSTHVYIRVHLRTHMCKHDFVESREQQEVFLL